MAANDRKEPRARRLLGRRRVFGERRRQRTIRLVQISDPDAKTLHEAFRNMRDVAKTTRVQKPLHHVSINPHKDERLTDEQVLRICDRLEESYGYARGQHQRVVVEHVKDGRQHFHVVWNRVSLLTGRPVWPGHHWNKSRQVARTMETALGLKRPTPRRTKYRAGKARSPATGGAERSVRSAFAVTQRSLLLPFRHMRLWMAPPPPLTPLPMTTSVGKQRLIERKPPRQASVAVQHPGLSREQLIAWAWRNGRLDILAQFGIFPGLRGLLEEQSSP